MYLNEQVAQELKRYGFDMVKQVALRDQVTRKLLVYGMCRIEQK
jgi:hypothetical protein